jgi:predicted DCC family thiol-disulfide oxidoreductase YuxK
MRSQRASEAPRAGNLGVASTLPHVRCTKSKPLLVLFDARCTRCRRLAAWLTSHDGDGSLTLRPTQDARVLRSYGITQRDARAAVHVVAEGEESDLVASGGAALLMVAGAFTGLRWTRRVAHTRPVVAIADAAYWLLTRRRATVDCC